MCDGTRIPFLTPRQVIRTFYGLWGKREFGKNSKSKAEELYVPVKHPSLCHTSPPRSNPRRQTSLEESWGTGDMAFLPRA